MTIKFRFKLQKKNNFMKLNTLVKIFSFFKFSKKEIAVINTREVKQIDHIFLIK
jgi:nicotinic acid phosphoribosyltransferase